MRDVCCRKQLQARAAERLVASVRVAQLEVQEEVVVWGAWEWEERWLVCVVLRSGRLLMHFFLFFFKRD
jgi:hypothetical protein